MGLRLPMLFAGVAVMGLGEIFDIVGVATHYWIESSEVGVSEGLWEHCEKINGDVKCFSLSSQLDLPSEYRTMQALAILGILGGTAPGFLAIFIALYTFAGKQAHKVVPLMTLAASICTFAFILATVMYYKNEIYDETKNFDLSYSFALSITGGVLFPVGAVLILVGGRMT